MVSKVARGPSVINEEIGERADKSIVYLADLTYTGRVMASNMMPLGIGLVGAYLLKTRTDIELDLFHYPWDLSEALLSRLPNVIGFASYTWNHELAYAFASRVKAHSPNTVVVFGGPNYGLVHSEMIDYWRRYPLIDFQVVLEGEQSFADLFEMLVRYNFDVTALKAAQAKPSNCHYQWQGELITGPLLPRIEDLNLLPSPYLSGLMDKFFDGKLVPLVHTTRGCPFTCTFCSEGASYFNKVKQRVDLLPELEYIGQRVGVIKEVRITDANFGMYKEDILKAHLFAQVRDKYGWPENILVSTGKNQQERVIEVGKILRGAMLVGASLQSTDPGVLEKIERTNISIEALQRVARDGNTRETNTYTELILCLPGDSVAKYTQSLRDVITAGMGVVRTYQLTMIPQTELNTPQSRTKYGMTTAFRIMQRGLGRHEVFGELFSSVEPEEVCIGNSTMSLADWVECRELGLTIEVIHNSDLYSDLAGLCRHFKLSWFDFLLNFYSKRRSYSPSITRLYDQFREDASEGLWSSREELVAEVTENLDKYLADTEGTNELSKGKAIATFLLFDEIHAVLIHEMEEILKKNGSMTELLSVYLREAREFGKYTKGYLLDYSAHFESDFYFDHVRLLDDNYRCNFLSTWSDDAVHYVFHNSESQAGVIKRYLDQYGTTIDGLGKILMSVPPKQLYRTVERVP